MNINKLLKSSKNLLLEAGIRIPEGIESFKILHHDDADGLGSAKMARKQIINQMLPRWRASGKISGMTDKEAIRFIDSRITTNTVTDSDEKNPRGVLEKIRKDPNQFLIVVDFDRFEKFGEEVLQRIRDMGGFDFHSDHHVRGSTEEYGRTGKVGATEYGSDTSHMADKTVSKGVNPRMVIQFTKWDTANFDENLERELGIVPGDDRYKPTRELASILSQITRSNKHLGAMEEFIKSDTDSIPAMLTLARKLAEAVDIHHRANAAAKTKATAPAKIRVLKEKIDSAQPLKKGGYAKTVEKNKEKLVKLQDDLAKADGIVQNAKRKLDEMGLTGRRWKIDPEGSTKLMGTLDFYAKKAREDLENRDETFSYRDQSSARRKKASRRRRVNASFEDNVEDLINEIKDTRREVLNRNPQEEPSMPPEASRDAKQRLRDKYKAKQGNRVVVSRLSGRGQPGRYTQFTFRNELGLKPLFGIRRWPTMMQVSLSPEAPKRIKRTVDLDKITGDVLKAAEKRFGIKGNRSSERAWTEILKGGEGYGHAAISTINGFYLLSGFALSYRDSMELRSLENDPVLSKLLNMKRTAAERDRYIKKMADTELERKYKRYKELKDLQKNTKEERKDAPGGPKEVMDWIEARFVEILEKMSKGVVVD